MTQPYSIDLRERAVALVEAGMAIREAAEILDISPSCLPKWRALKRRTGCLSPGQIGGRKKRTLSGEPAVWLTRRMREAAFTLRGLVAELAEQGIKTDSRAVWVFAHEQKLSFKKNCAGRRTGAS
jgi:putative transposase